MNERTQNELNIAPESSQNRIKKVKCDDWAFLIINLNTIKYNEINVLIQ